MLQLSRLIEQYNKRDELNKTIADMVSTCAAGNRDRFNYWINQIDEEGRQYNLVTVPKNRTHFTLAYQVSRHDPLFEDYEKRTDIPFEYLDTEDWKGYVDGITMSRQIAKKKKRLEEQQSKLRDVESKMKTIAKERDELISQLKKEVK